MRRAGQTRRILAIVALGVPALASASQGSPGATPQGTIVFVSNLSPAAAASGRRVGESRIHAFSIEGRGRLDITHAASGSSDSAAALSPDGRRIAFFRTARATDNAELWIADTDGTNARRLLAPKSLESFTYSDSEPYFQRPAWSPRGDVIAIDVVSTASCSPGSTKCASWYTALVGLDGRRRDAGGVNAVWSPTGGELLVRGGLFSLEDASEWILGLTRADGSNGWDTKTGWKRPDACWSGGSWSPDGSRLVLTESRCDGSARRLHVVGAKDGGRRAVVRGCCASWSPDGRRLAYIAFHTTGNLLTVATRDGRRLHALGRASQFAWSPRGERLAFVRPLKAGEELVMARADGTAPRVLARTGHHGIEVGSWAKDGRRFAFFRRERDRAELVITRGDGTHPRVLAHRAGRVLTRARWSDAGRRLAFWDVLEDTTGHLVVVDTDTGRLRTVYDALEGAYSNPVGWTADGRTLLLLETASGLYPDELWTIRPDGSGLRRLTRNKRGELDPAWSPDGTRIAFWRDDPRRGRKPEELSVHVMGGDGTGIHKVVGGAAGSYASDPDWSPDGRSLAFQRWTDSNHQDVWVVGLGGKGLRRVTRTGHSSAPAWSPDGRSIAFSDDGVPRVIAPDGTGMTRLFERADVQYCSGFSWSRDRRIAATCGIPGGLFVAPADGSELRVVDRSADRAASWSPDAEWLVYGAENALRIVDANGGSPTTIDLRGATASQPDWSSR